MAQQEIKLPITRGDIKNARVEWVDRLPVNMYATMRDIQGAKGYLQSFYGLRPLATGLGDDRGAVWNERLKTHFRISGNRLIAVSSSGNVTDLGYIDGFRQVSLPYSFNTQGIVSGGRFYLYDGSSLTEVKDPNLGSPIDATWIDGYYFFTDGENLYHTNILDESKIDPLSYGTAELSPDPTLAVATTQDNKVIVFGRYSIEYFQNIATDNFAFTRLSNRAIRAGIVGTHCKCEMAGVWYIIGGRKKEGVSIHAIDVGGIVSIATRYVDRLLDNYSEEELSNAVLESFEDGETRFLLVRLPRETLLYNQTIASTMGKDFAWSVLQKEPLSKAKMPLANGVFDPRIAKWVFAENDNKRVGLLDANTCEYFGQMIEQIFYSPFVEMAGLTVDDVELDIIGNFVKEQTTVFSSLSYDALAFGKEFSLQYGTFNGISPRFLAHRLGGYVNKSVCFKFRAVTSSRLAFSDLTVRYG